MLAQYLRVATPFFVGMQPLTVELYSVFGGQSDTTKVPLCPHTTNPGVLEKMLVNCVPSLTPCKKHGGNSLDRTVT